MLHEEDDPLSSSIFDIPSNSTNMLGNSMSASMFSSQYEEDPWGGSSTMERSFPSSNLNYSTTHTTSDAIGKPQVQLTASTVLGSIKLPDIYDSLFSQNQRSGRVSLSSLNDLLSKGNITAYQIERIMQVVVPNGASYVTRSEFNTAIALLACAQNNIDVSLEQLFKNRNYLPEPSIHYNEQHQKMMRPTTNHPISSPKTNGHSSYPGMTKRSPTLLSNASDDDQDEEEVDLVQNGAEQNGSNSERKGHLDTRHWFQNVEDIQVTVAPEREGFIFKHVNYIVTNEKRSSIVLRRYSDFWWLLEVLLRRYPFRSLPNLPPKKLGGRDAAFLEKRRKGLSRFINAIIRHPILKQDEIVNKFLTEPSELSAWRKQNPPILEEEFKRKPYPIRELEDMLPDNLEEQLQKAKKRITAGVNHYINLCFIMERMIRRMHGQATDFSRYSIALNSLAEAELRYHAGECRNCQHVVKGYELVAKHMQQESGVLEDQVGNATDGVLENLKRFRDLLVSFRDLEERREKLSSNQTDAITKRISSNRSKINQSKGVPGIESEVERLEEAVRADERELAAQKDRLVFIAFCMWSELIYLHKQQAFVSLLYQDYVKEAIHFSKRRVDNWQDLEAPTFDMPTDVNLFE